MEYIDNIPEQIPGIDKLFGCDKNGGGPENRPLFHRSKGENWQLESVPSLSQALHGKIDKFIEKSLTSYLNRFKRIKRFSTNRYRSWQRYRHCCGAYVSL